MTYGETGVLEALDQIHDLATSVLDAPAWQLSDTGIRDAVAGSFAAVQQLEAVYLNLLFELDQRPGAVKGARPGYVARTFARHALNRTSGQAKLDAEAAYALHASADPAQGGMPRLGAGLAAGEVSRAHVDVAVRAVRHIPKRLLAREATRDPSTDPNADLGAETGAGQSRCAGHVVDEVITKHATTYDSFALTRIAQRLIDYADPDAARSFDPEACSRRNLRLARDHDGMWVLRGELAPADGIEVPDERTTGQRYADALMELARAGHSSGRIGTRGGDHPGSRLSPESKT